MRNFMNIDIYDNEYYHSKWMRYLEIHKIKKILVSKYNTKQALIKALRKLGLSKEFSSNEVLLQFIVSELKNEMEPFSYDVSSDSLEYFSKEDACEEFASEFVDLVEEYVDLLREKIVVTKNGQQEKISILDMDFDTILEKNPEEYIRNLIKSYYFRDHSLEFSAVSFDREQKTTTIMKNSSDFVSKNANYGGWTSDTSILVYDQDNHMIEDSSYDYTDVKLDLDDIFLAREKYYTSMNQTKVNKETQMLECQCDGNVVDTTGIKLEYDIHSIDFMSFIDETFENSEVEDCSDQKNELFASQIEFYQSRGIPKEDYWIDWKDPKFYSMISDFSVVMMKSIDQRMKKKELEKFKRI